MKEVTRLLQRLGQGDARAADELLPLVYDRLHELARGYMANERRGHTLQATALVHEAWLRLERSPEDWLSTPEAVDRNAFLSVAARAMRRVLVDHARRRRAAKRGTEPERVPLDETLAQVEETAGDVLVLDEALTRLGAADEELARIVELRFFAGLTVFETADVLSVSHRRVERGWVSARVWLMRELGR